MTWNAVETYAAPGRGQTRMRPDWLARVVRGAATAAQWRWRSHRTRRALMQLDDRQREDCGINRPDVPTRSCIEAAARRKLVDGMPADWC